VQTKPLSDNLLVPSFKDTLPAYVAIGGAWLLTILQLQTQWNLNPQYTYGWLTVPLAIFLLWRETEIEPLTRNKVPHSQAILLSVGFLCIFLYFPLWLIREANPQWRLLNWLIFLPVAGLTASWFYCTGGVQYMRRILFPLFFVATSIPWLLSWDLRLATFLQNKVSYFVCETLLLAGRSAEIEGNLIRLTNCTVGVDEACSGIRGLQSSLVVALFLGQYLRLKIPVRLFLLIAALGCAFMLNLLRASFLAHLSASKGTDMASRWHDPIGIAESLGTLVLLCLLIVVLIRFFKIPNQFHIDDTTHGSFNFLKNPYPKKLGIAAAIWFPLTILFTLYWYSYNEKKIPESPRIEVDFHKGTRKYEKQRISDAIRAQLNYSQAISANWTSENGQSFIGFYCRWEQGSGSPLALAVHTPEVCLQLRGYRLIKKYHGIEVKFPFMEQSVPFEAYTFSYKDQTVHIYRCYWPDRLLDGKFPGFPTQGYNTSGRIEAAFKGYRNPGANMIAIGIFETPFISNFELATETIQGELAARILQTSD